MTTRDGRLAQRPIAHPEDLAPTLSALMTTVAMPSDETTRPEEHPSRTPDADVQPTVRDVAPQLPVPSSNGGHVVIAGAVGARWGTPSQLVGPLLQVSAGLSIPHWELGVFAEIQPIHASPSELPDGFRMWSAGAGLAAGARIPAGAFALVGGARLGVGIVSQTATPDSEGNAQDATEIKLEASAARSPNR